MKYSLLKKRLHRFPKPAFWLSLNIFVGLAVGMMALTTNSLAFTLKDIPTYTLRYSVTFKGTNIGELEIKIEKENNRAIVHGETFPNALANLFGDGKVIEIIEYTSIGDKLLLSRITEKKGTNKPDVTQLKVDHQKNQLITQSKNIVLSKSDQIDAYTFPLLSILGLTDTGKNQKEKLVSANKINNYHFLPSSTENIKTPAGTFKTSKQTKVRDDKSKTVMLWLSQQKPIMPVKIQVNRKGKQRAVIELINIKN